MVFAKELAFSLVVFTQLEFQVFSLRLEFSLMVFVQLKS